MANRVFQIVSGLALMLAGSASVAVSISRAGIGQPRPASASPTPSSSEPVTASATPPVAGVSSVARPPSRAPSGSPATSASAEPPDAGAPEDDPEPTTLEAQRERLFARMHDEMRLSDAQLQEVKRIFAASSILSQGNPEIAQHPMTRAECRAIRAEAKVVRANDPRCGAPDMVPIFDPAKGETRETAKVCIDQLEFPDIPCEYPVVQVRSNEAGALCRAVGKRICDAHEWEGACAGALHDPSEEYAFGRPRPEATFYHNLNREKVWAYGKEKDHSLCGTKSRVTPGCSGGGWKECGSNTYPTGAFPRCVSPFGVYDLHGNAAEHMNLPSSAEEFSRLGDGGLTEMKGSWFVFSGIEAHDDDCRWRARDWHPSRLDNENSHRNYHLGFRCCKDVE
jgi:formylglycine-generating enzyme